MTLPILKHAWTKPTAVLILVASLLSGCASQQQPIDCNAADNQWCREKIWNEVQDALEEYRAWKTEQAIPV